MLILLSVAMLLGAPAQESGSSAAELTLVVEGAAGDGYVYTANGKVLDPKRVVTGLQTMLRATDPGQNRMLVLFNHDISLGKTFEFASLIEGVMGLKDVR